MSTAEATTTAFADNIGLGDSLVNMKVLEVLQLTKYLKEAYGLEAAAAAPVMMQAGPAAPTEAVAQTEFDVVLEAIGDQQDQRHQGGACGHDPRPQGGQGSRGVRSEGDQDGRLQGRRREAQEGAGGRRRSPSRSSNRGTWLRPAPARRSRRPTPGHRQTDTIRPAPDLSALRAARPGAFRTQADSRRPEDRGPAPRIPIPPPPLWSAEPTSTSVRRIVPGKKRNFGRTHDEFSVPDLTVIQTRKLRGDLQADLPVYQKRATPGSKGSSARSS